MRRTVKLYLKRKLHGEEGMTLVEVLAAMGILSISLLTILLMYQFNYKSSVDSLQRTVATNLARQGIESLREGDITAGESEEDIVIDGVDYKRKFIVTYDEDSELYDITVQVFFNNNRKVEFIYQRT